MLYAVKCILISRLINDDDDDDDDGTYYYFYFLFEGGGVGTIFGCAQRAGREAEGKLYLQKRVFLSCSFAFFSAGNIPSDRILTEEDWAVDEVSSTYEKSKRRAEKTAWELVKNLPGEQQETFSLLTSSLIFS